MQIWPWLVIGALVLLVLVLAGYIIWRQWWPLPSMSEEAEKNLADDMMMGIEK